jgi:hypothetical protein
MKWHLLLLVTLLGVLLTGVGVAVTSSHMHQSPAYMVDAVQTLLARDPGAWVGKTVLVRGVAEQCLRSGSPARFLYCHHRPQDLLDPGLAGANERLPLVWGTQSGWLAVLRRLPVVGRLLPRRQTLKWGSWQPTAFSAVRRRPTPAPANRATRRCSWMPRRRTISLAPHARYAPMSPGLERGTICARNGSQLSCLAHASPHRARSTPVADDGVAMHWPRSANCWRNRSNPEQAVRLGGITAAQPD